MQPNENSKMNLVEEKFEELKQLLDNREEPDVMGDPKE